MIVLNNKMTFVQLGMVLFLGWHSGKDYPTFWASSALSSAVVNEHKGQTSLGQCYGKGTFFTVVRFLSALSRSLSNNEPSCCRSSSDRQDIIPRIDSLLNDWL